MFTQLKKDSLEKNVEQTQDTLNEKDAGKIEDPELESSQMSSEEKKSVRASNRRGAKRSWKMVIEGAEEKEEPRNTNHKKRKINPYPEESMVGESEISNFFLF